MNKKILGVFLGVFLLPFSLHAADDEILQKDADGVRKYVEQLNKGIRARDPYSTPESMFILEGCLGGKKGEQFENKASKVTVFYYSELFKRNTKQVTRVHMAFPKPVSVGAAQNMIADFVDFLRGKNFTQQQKMEPENDECKPKNGGLEYRYTRDYFIEFYYAPGSKLIQEARLWNGNYNN
ncbi:MAG: hypothetical protein U1F57_01500 [bacterium]